MPMRLLNLWGTCLLLFVTVAHADEPATTGRRPSSDTELCYWLQNMARHKFTDQEKQAALGLSAEELQAAYERLKLSPDESLVAPEGRLEVLPYPGGRHPRIGFLDGAIDPQRETKASIFLPWDKQSYVVADIPEALWSNLGLTYLAHTHIDTIWTKAGVPLKPQEWERHDDGRLTLTRKLPNGIEYQAAFLPQKDHVQMTLSLHNGTKERLSDLRVQNCVMLKGARGFEQQTNDNKRFAWPLAAAGSTDGRKWIITAWQRCHNPWGNAACPCLHSDPQFPDLAPGERSEIKGWLWFYEGEEIEKELARLKEAVAGQ